MTRPHARRPGARLIAVLAVAAATLAGCEGDQQELRAWMEQQRREVKPNVEPLTAPKKFDPAIYVGGNAADPFSAQKLAVAIKADNRQPSTLLAAELARRKQPLEAFPLDAMQMVGSLVRQGRPVALLRVDGLLYQVAVGEYLGQNYGKILRISETELSLREIVPDAAGEMVERNATLQLQEKGQEKPR